METYPGELLVGVFPLVFCVDATLKKQIKEGPGSISSSTTVPGTESSTVETSESLSHPSQKDRRLSSSRSQFDNFLDAMAASLTDEETVEHPLQTRSSDGGGRSSVSSGDHHHRQTPNMISLFRGDEDEEEISDAEDDLILGSLNQQSNTSATAASTGSTISTSSPSDGQRNQHYGDVSSDDRPPRLNSLPKLNFPRLGPGINSVNGRRRRSNRNKNNRRAVSADANDSGSGGISIDTSFAAALQQGQSFFQRARIVSISTRHGFPPSKDSTGEKNRILEYLVSHGNSKKSGAISRNELYSDNVSLETSKVVTATERRPIDGILPSGWLEKHSAALPSVILIVLQVHHDKETQKQQDEMLRDTLQSLQHSLAPKRLRFISIKVVGLIQEGVSTIVGEQWAQGMTEKLSRWKEESGDDSKRNTAHRSSLNSATAIDAVATELTLLKLEDLKPDHPYDGSDLQNLHRSVRNSSLRYYWHQTKEVKEKLLKMGSARRTPLMLPLAIRYYFKAAIFYEFQWRQGKSLKYMVEAYRSVESYYRFLLQQREITQYNELVQSEKGEGCQNATRSIDLPTISAADSIHTHTEEAGEGVELSLTSLPLVPSKKGASNDTDIPGLLFFNADHPPYDMVHQCRAVADWLNFKILQSGLVSNTGGGLLAASMQWQRHMQAFCCPRRTFVSSPEASWLDWSYVAQQRTVISQLLERYPPRAFGSLSQDELDEVTLRCSPWRTYEAAAEALLKVGYSFEAAEDAQSLKELFRKENIDDMRTRYVGGIDHERFNIMYEDLSKTDQKEKALNCALRGLSLYDKEVDDFCNADKIQPLLRSKARLHFLAGTALFGLSSYAEAIAHLEKISEMCKGWNGLVDTIQRMLVECYKGIEVHGPDSLTCSSSKLASIQLDLHFSTNISKNSLWDFLDRFATTTGLESNNLIHWHKECSDEDDDSMPFCFALAFPVSTHATSGDSATAHVWIKSNLDYAVHLESATLMSAAGPLNIPSKDLLRAKNANEGSNGGIIIQASNDIEFSMQITLPGKLDEIVSDEAGNFLAGKGTKSARPRTGGITSAAGARFLSERSLTSVQDAVSQSLSSQWNLQCLGGKPLRYDGLILIFNPVNISSDVEKQRSRIELTINKQNLKTEAQVKRTPFEEDNYLSSAWKRPKRLPMNFGPQCLRVLPPLADMSVTNITESFTNGKALEGTVNRIVLKLKAGRTEMCSNIVVRATCASSLVLPHGKTKQMVTDCISSIIDGDVVDTANPQTRAPVLVKPNTASKSGSTNFGFELPNGWSLFGDGTGASDEYSPEADNLIVTPSLNCGESTFIYVDIYRPSQKLLQTNGAAQAEAEAEPFEIETHSCHSEINLCITYQQEREGNAEKIPARSRGRKAKINSEDNVGTGGDSVSLDYKVKVLWVAPISVAFSSGQKEFFPSGNRHPTNIITHSSERNSIINKSFTEMVLTDRERVISNCSLEASVSADSPSIEIIRVIYEDSNNEESPCRFTLLSADREGGVLYRSSADDPSRELGFGSKLSVSWMTQVNMNSAYLKGSLTAFLGALSVHWRPVPVELPSHIELESDPRFSKLHGPLRLEECSICRFRGPRCYIENAPFAVKAGKVPNSIQVAAPFELAYTITNKTPLDQDLELQVEDLGVKGEELGWFLMDGQLKSAANLGPFEAHSFSYMFLPTRVGQLNLPRISVSSRRYGTWVIHEIPEHVTIFVLP